jgi:hypothetical protein
MLMLAATLLAAVPPPTGFSLSVDRVAVRATIAQPTVVVEPLTARVVLRGLVLTGKAPALCPVMEKRDGAVVLRCTTRRLWAELASDKRGAFVDLRELRGLSWLDRDTHVPMHPWSLRAVGIPDVCPGTAAAARAECAFQRGDLEQATNGWVDALSGPDVTLARVRLGDLAVADGDLETALKHYSKATPIGPVGRLAQARSCELIGTCLSREESDRVANVEGMPAELARDQQLHTLRRDLFAGRDLEAMARLQALLEADATVCDGAIEFCQRLIEAGLDSRDVEARIAALSVFLTDKVRHGPHELVLNDQAAKTARELGAPGFAATILAANTPHVPRAELSEHLLNIVRLYVAARDPVRAAVVLEYAEGKLGAATRVGGWASARRQLGRASGTTVAAPVSPVTDAAALDELSSQVSLSADLARAAAARTRAVMTSVPPTAVETAP